MAVRDFGLLEAALARPPATAFGKDAYPSLDAKAAVLLHSLARSHALTGGGKRVAAGELDRVEEISAVLQGATAPRR